MDVNVGCHSPRPGVSDRTGTERVCGLVPPETPAPPHPTPPVLVQILKGNTCAATDALCPRAGQQGWAARGASLGVCRQVRDSEGPRTQASVLPLPEAQQRLPKSSHPLRELRMKVHEGVALLPWELATLTPLGSHGPRGGGLQGFLHAASWAGQPAGAR